MSGPKRIAIVLFQLGGPDTQAAVEPFLYNFSAIRTSLISPARFSPVRLSQS